MFATSVLCSEELQRGSFWSRDGLLASSKTLAKTQRRPKQRSGWATEHLLIDLRLPAALCLLCLAALCLLRFADAHIHSWQIGAAFPAAPIMSHTARQALTIFQQWLIAEFKTLSESLKEPIYGAALCRAHCQAAQMYFYINKVQLTLEQPPLNDALFNSISKCFVSSPGS